MEVVQPADNIQTLGYTSASVNFLQHSFKTWHLQTNSGHDHHNHHAPQTTHVIAVLMWLMHFYAWIFVWENRQLVLHFSTLLDNSQLDPMVLGLHLSWESACESWNITTHLTCTQEYMLQHRIWFDSLFLKAQLSIDSSIDLGSVGVIDSTTMWAKHYLGSHRYKLGLCGL